MHFRMQTDIQTWNASGLKKAISEYFTQQSCSIQSEDVIPGNGASELFMAIAHAIKPKKSSASGPGLFRL